MYFSRFKYVTGSVYKNKLVNSMINAGHLVS